LAVAGCAAQPSAHSTDPSAVLEEAPNGPTRAQRAARIAALLPDPASCLVRYASDTSALKAAGDVKPGAPSANPFHFYDLHDGDATFEKVATAQVVGHVIPKALRELGGRAVFEYLWRDWVPGDPDFCMTREVSTPGSYRAELSGYIPVSTWVYPLRFVFEIDPDGTLRISPQGDSPGVDPHSAAH
jgi:hypothetical protein